jgi:hypothetical protein
MYNNWIRVLMWFSYLLPFIVSILYARKDVGRCEKRCFFFWVSLICNHIQIGFKNKATAKEKFITYKFMFVLMEDGPQLILQVLNNVLLGT